MINRIRRFLFGPQRPTIITAAPDASRTNTDNVRHWAAADALSADASGNASVRAELRKRCRYEFSSSSYLKGMIITLANDVVGTEPRLQMLGTDDERNATIEAAWLAWSAAVRLGDMLRTRRITRAISGESFVYKFIGDEVVPGVRLRYRLLEPDHVTTSAIASLMSNTLYDGIEYDDMMMPRRYYVLKRHPGDVAPFINVTLNDYDTIDARLIWHDYKVDRPGQRRGIPEVAPALPLLAKLRAYTEAVVKSASTAARLAMVLESSSPADADAADFNGRAGTAAAAGAVPEVYDTIALEDDMATVLPTGYKLGGFKAEQPTTTYEMFVDTLIRECARSINMPFTIAALDSSKANMSAAYLDQMAYARSCMIDRREIAGMLDWLFETFILELTQAGIVTDGDNRHEWRFDAIGQHADPYKVANAKAEMIANGLSDIPAELAMQGRDYEDSQRAAAESLGVTLEEYRRLLRDKLFPPAPVTAPAPQTPTN